MIPPASPTSPNQPDKPKFVIPLSSKAPTGPHPNPLSAYNKNQEVNRLTRELWNIRREISAFHARESTILGQIEKLAGRGASLKHASTIEVEPSSDQGIN